jgi:hypothetical protein
MKSGEWKTYRTRFLVKAKQLSSSLSFVDPLGRQHSGRRGDYLVESADGVVSIAPRQIFEDIYISMELQNEHAESDRVDEIVRPARGKPSRGVGAPVLMPSARKMPQGCRERRSTGSNLGYM